MLLRARVQLTRRRYSEQQLFSGKSAVRHVRYACSALESTTLFFYFTFNIYFVVAIAPSARYVAEYVTDIAQVQ